MYIVTSVEQLIPESATEVSIEVADYPVVNIPLSVEYLILNQKLNIKHLTNLQKIKIVSSPINPIKLDFDDLPESVNEIIFYRRANWNFTEKSDVSRINKISFNGNLHHLNRFAPNLEELIADENYNHLYLREQEFIEFPKLFNLDPSFSITVFNPSSTFAFPKLQELKLNIEMNDNYRDEFVDNFVSSIKKCKRLNKLHLRLDISSSEITLDFDDAIFDIDLYILDDKTKVNIVGKGTYKFIKWYRTKLEDADPENDEIDKMMADKMKNAALNSVVNTFGNAELIES